ncbi:MAG TPA: hypothetical protein VFJ64_10500 [Solirubrobacterales bacterium]|nr:hypothetical protein [Solirubrobacterales bacterium]
MKSIKMLGHAALAALMAMAFVGASSATASTHLCKTDESSCAAANIITHVHETSVGKASLLASPEVQCGGDLFLGEVVGEGEAGQLEIEGNFTYSSCGSGCTVTEQSATSIIEIEKVGHETGAVVGEAEVHVNCTGINCWYSGKELAGTAKGPLLSAQTPDNGEVSRQEQIFHKVKGFFCPSTFEFDLTTTPLSATYITE